MRYTINNTYLNADELHIEIPSAQQDIFVHFMVYHNLYRNRFLFLFYYCKIYKDSDDIRISFWNRSRTTDSHKINTYISSKQAENIDYIVLRRLRQ